MSDRLPPYRTFLASDAEIRDALRDARTIAAVGVDHDADACDVLKGMRRYGYRILAVGRAAESAGLESVADLRAIAERVDIVQVYGDPAQAPEASVRAVELGARMLWLERGVSNPKAAYDARQRGLRVVMNRRILDEYEMHFPDDEVGYTDDP